MDTMTMNIHGVRKVEAEYNSSGNAYWLTFNFDGAFVTMFFERPVDESRVKALQDALAGLHDDQSKELAA